MKVILMSFARVSVTETLSRDPRMPLEGALMVIEGRKCPYYIPQNYPFLRDPRKRLAFLASDAVL